MPTKLEEIAQLLQENGRYYAGPGFSDAIGGIAKMLGAFSPGGDMIDMADSSRDLMASKGGWDTVSALGGLGTATLGMALPGRPKQMADEVTQGIRAYHGSPHDFDRFSLDKIGTGEGAQAYGHGLYATDLSDIGRGYRDSLTPDHDMRIGGKPVQDLYSAMENRAAGLPIERAQPEYNKLALLEDLMNGGDVLHIREQAANGAYSPEAMAWFERDVAPKFKRNGVLYEVNIAASPEDFLDWDRPLSEQSEKVRGALPNVPPSLSGKDAYGAIIDEYVPSPREAAGVASKKWQDRGIPGIRYLDQGSRTAGDGSRNYVVFDENLINIMRKYAMLGGLTGLGGLAAMQPDSEPKY